MTFGLQCEDEMEDWLLPGHLAVRVHEGGHRLLRTTRLCKMLYLRLLGLGFDEMLLAARVHELATSRSIGLENAFAQVVLGLAREHGVELSTNALHQARKGYAERQPVLPRAS